MTVDEHNHQRPGSITLHDVAREAGVSLATASRALNGSSRKVADSYRARVVAAADRLGYTPNASAQATARGSSSIVALLVADIADPYFGEMAAGVARGADEAGLVMTIAVTGRDATREVDLVRALRGQRPRGVILAASRTSQLIDAPLAKEIDAIAANGGRVVAFGTTDPSVRSVAIDNRGGAHALGSTLGQLGYTNAIILGAPEGVLTSDARIDGFSAGFTAGGGSSPTVYRGAFTRESGAEMMTQALRDGVSAGTVVFGISDVVALGAFTALRDAGRAVGADIALCGFDDIGIVSDLTPALTTVRVPLDDAGYLSLRAAIDDDWTQEPGALPLRVVLRESTPSRR